jgi:MoaA/NifB/PqqE/SkfB family radical SAM enzyme
MWRSAILPASGYIFTTYLLLRRRKPFLASFKPTYRCNLRCQQCPFFSLGGEDLSFPEALAVLDRLRQRGNRLLIFEGGEPMLWRDGERTIQDLVTEARRRFLCLGMTTNGTRPLDVGTDILWVSIDGFADTHDRLRGAPVFERVIQNIRSSRHPRIYAHLTLNSQNYAEAPDLVRFLSGIVKGITIQFYYPYAARDSLFLDFERREILLDEMMALKRQGYPLLNSMASLKALKRNTWRCDDWLVDNANPDGTINQGCYLRGRADIDCARCGFSPHTEISLAYQGNLRAIMAGIAIFFNR